MAGNKKFTIDHTKVDSNLTHFPLTVHLDNSNGSEIFSELAYISSLNDDFTGANGSDPNSDKWEASDYSIQSNKLSISHVSGNSDLGAFGISNLISVGGGINISYNTAFVDFDLSSLISVSGGLTVMFNEVLPDCKVCTLLSQLIISPTLVAVNNNFDDSCTPIPTGCP